LAEDKARQGQSAGRDLSFVGFDGSWEARVTTARALVERFYNEVWNQADERAAREILHRNFIFRGSLGPERRGPDGFIDYLRAVHAALAGFTCTIEELIEMQERAAAKMLFRGTHRALLFGIEATGRDIVWNGAAFFKVKDGLIAELWVLGDIDAVKRQLMPDVAHSRFSMP
jgi:predicted ester cyclase